MVFFDDPKTTFVNKINHYDMNKSEMIMKSVIYKE